MKKPLLLKTYISGMLKTTTLLGSLGLALMLSTPVFPADPPPATTFFFSTGNPDGRIASVSHPEGRGKTEHESADDFILTKPTILMGASFTGLLDHGGPGEIKQVVVELYHVFPKDSNTTRTPQVPTRVNSPGDKRFDARSSEDGTLQYTVTVLNPHFQVANSVIEGINPLPNQTTGGEGPVAGQEVQISVLFDPPFVLPADQYFFVPQVLLQGEGGNFLWLSAPHPEFTNDLQMWVRKEDLKPDWLRVGQDIVGGSPFPTFNGSFSLIGVIP